jgi:hypothetical protein
MIDHFVIQSDEALYFGPPQSVTAGDVTRSRSTFPPPAWAWQGILRTQVLRQGPLGSRLQSARPAEVAASVGPPDALPDGWSISGPLPALVGPDGWEPWLPLPRALGVARPAGAVDASIAWARPQASDGLTSGHPGPLVGVRPPLRLLDHGWISASGLERALQGVSSLPPAALQTPRPKGGGEAWPFDPDRPAQAAICAAKRVGVAIDPNTGLAVDEELYTLTEHRLGSDAGLYGSLERPSGQPLAEGDVALGRGQRPGRMLVGPRLHPAFRSLMAGAHLAGVGGAPRQGLILLLTPALLPSAQIDDPSSIRLGGLTVRTALWQAGPVLGGFSMVGGRPRASAVAVGAGSCLWVEGTAQSLYGALGQRIGAQTSFGFGQTLPLLLPERP